MSPTERVDAVREWFAGQPWSVQIWIGTAVAGTLALPLGLGSIALFVAGALTGLIVRGMYE